MSSFRTRRLLQRLPDRGTPRRLAELLRRLDDDLARVITIPHRPQAVEKAAQGWERARTAAKTVIDGRDAAERAENEQRAKDIDAAVKALQAGDSAPVAKYMGTAQTATATSTVAFDAAEQLLLQAHEDLIAASYSEWPQWAQTLDKRAEAGQQKASRQLASAEEAVQAAAAAYNGRGILDAELKARDQKIAKQVERERREGIDWYGATHDAVRPLTKAAVPGQKDKGKPVYAPLAPMLASVRAAVDAEAHNPLSAWLPPGAEGRDEILSAPLADLSAPWVVAAVRRAQGDACAICGNGGPDAVVRDGSTLVLVHRACVDRPLSPKEEAARARRERHRAHGYPPAPFTTPF